MPIVISDVHRLEFQLAALQQEHAAMQQEMLRLREAVAHTALENVRLLREVTKNAVQQATQKFNALAQTIQAEYHVTDLGDVDWTTGAIRPSGSPETPAGPDHPGD